jgi:hypothetical protein
MLSTHITHTSANPSHQIIVFNGKKRGGVRREIQIPKSQILWWS